MEYRLVFIFLILLGFKQTFGLLGHKKLKYYEVVDSSQVRHVIQKRSTDGRKDLSLSLLGRTFELSLIPRPELFSQNFEAVTVGSDGTEKEFKVNKNDFYHGYVKGATSPSSVTMEIDDDMITAAIEIEEDTYHLEPAAGQIDGDIANKMIAYRNSDVIWNVTFAGNHTQRQKYCGMIDAGNRTETNNNYHEMRSSRKRRSLKIKRDCSLALVADYRYYKHIGRNSKKKTLYSMVGVINRVDQIFRNTDWSDDDKDPYKDFGFVIKKIIVNEAPTKNYNRQSNRPWMVKELLLQFSREDWSDYCLAHLFTYQDFRDGVIGLAYVAHADRNSRGGICSAVDRNLYHNTGLSSSINWGNQLLTSESDIVTAHEFGHNFGSEHDVQDDPLCSPESNGKFIMYPASVSGQNTNNNKFSICSRRAVKAVLESKSSLCFDVPSSGSFCGNYRVDSGEECDQGEGENDKCCRNCKLIGDAKCSDTNSLCCSDCQYASNTTQCRQAKPLVCKKASYCSGFSKDCPEAQSVEEGTSCIERGKCSKDGKCDPFCKRFGGEPCLCSNEEDACYVCCKKKDEPCVVYRNGSLESRLPLSDGRLCSAGVCSGQKCRKTAQDIITRLQDFLDTLGDPSKFGELLKDNIVGTVIIFSLLLWIPISYVVHRIDKRRDKQAQELARWQDIANHDLIRQPNKRRDNFDVVFKKDSVLIRDSRKARPRGATSPRQWGPTVE
ncbi:ADAM 17-like protease [Xenia sp. Carnegie-2017]|uniref:ADAM 17-like protease n=1 Tax=Xenia sp. Carnegie-2017 TaxID=2897299 RepID=UPI001F04DBA4|nr:ADAM 17-like protease [Xenia sp. Carnegie-2017]